MPSSSVVKWLQMCQVRNHDTNNISDARARTPRLCLQLGKMTWTTFTPFPARSAQISILWAHFAARLKQLKGWHYKSMPDLGDTCENEAALYADATSHAMHIPLRGGRTASRINRSPFQSALCSPTCGQLAAISCQDRTQQSRVASDSIMLQALGVINRSECTTVQYHALV